jgi:phosphatidylglycerophosphate synthase
MGIIGLAITPFHLILAGYSAKREILTGQILALLIFILDLGLMSFQIYAMYHGDGLYSWYNGTRRRETAYMALALPLLLFSLVMGVVRMSSFGYGLKPYLQKMSIPADQRMSAEVRMRSSYESTARYGSQPSHEVSMRYEID